MQPRLVRVVGDAVPELESDRARSLVGVRGDVDAKVGVAEANVVGAGAKPGRRESGEREGEQSGEDHPTSCEYERAVRKSG